MNTNKKLTDNEKEMLKFALNLIDTDKAKQLEKIILAYCLDNQVSTDVWFLLQQTLMDIEDDTLE